MICNKAEKKKNEIKNKEIKKKKKESKIEIEKKKPVVVPFKPPDEYPWQGRNSFLYYKIVLCNKYKYNILFDQIKEILT